MAGAFTHLMICDVGKRKDELAEAELKKILNKYSQFLLLGSVSPDIPCLSSKFSSIHWEELMHKSPNTNGIVLSGYEELKNKFTQWQATERVIFAWLMGYVSHMIADSIVHPIVNTTVGGNYEGHEKEHARCETVQDTMIFKEVKKLDIVYAEFVDLLDRCKNHPSYGLFLDFWKKHAKATYHQDSGLNPNLWIEIYRGALDTADESNIPAFFRHIPVIGQFFYEEASKIKANYPQDYDNYYANVKLPSGASGSFLEDGFNYAVERVVEAWNGLYAGLNSPFIVASLIKNWNLDTGEDKKTGQKTYWG